ncbi:ParA family protein [Mycoplasma putrefaciens]|uniref:AAA domain-containing protein n=1 Tax=Mycoplasma putrefaciens Mput9231 TaxID=1292033 RepID=M9W9M5_9MOLU|nr:ParA family protein [Mycoplasma putrefaciens]AGJ90708.1 Hypothetical protein, putative hydrolase [Mycoplasma putrefaciens Mput9231]
MKNYKKIIIYNNKGGVGKTIITANLAVYLAMQNKKILLIDFDRQRSLTNCFTNSKQEESWKIFDRHATPEILQSDIHPNIWIIPGDPKIEPLIPFMAADVILKEFENKNFNKFDYIFFDLHSALTTSTQISLKNADSLILLTDASLNSSSILIEFVEQWKYTMECLNLKNNTKAVILNRYQPSYQADETLDLLNKNVSKYLVKTNIPNQANIAKSVLPEQKWMYEASSTREMFKNLIDELIIKGVI